MDLWAQFSTNHCMLAPCVFPTDGCKTAPNHEPYLPDRCPSAPVHHCCFQTSTGSHITLLSYGCPRGGSSAKCWNSSCSFKSDKSLMSARETTLTWQPVFQTVCRFIAFCRFIPFSRYVGSMRQCGALLHCPLFPVIFLKLPVNGIFYSFPFFSLRRLFDHESWSNHFFFFWRFSGLDIKDYFFFLF